MSKFMYFDFRCTGCEHKFSDLVKPDVQETPCPECGEEAKRMISAPRLSNDMESRENHWVKQNRQKTAQDKKFYADHGVDKKHHSYGS